MQISRPSFERLNRRMLGLTSEFEPFRSKGADIQRYMIPWRGRGLGGDSASEDQGMGYNDSSIHNTSIINFIQIAAAGLKSGISPASRPWFRVGLRGVAMSDVAGPQGKWLSEVEKMIYATFAQTNVYDALLEIYLEMFTFGTGVAIIVPDPERIIRLRTLTYGEYLLANNFSRQVDTMGRKFYMTCSQLVGEFGIENVSDSVKTAHTNGNHDTRFKVNMLIEPNDGQMDMAGVGKRKFRSVYWETGNAEKVLAVRGFDEFPCISGTWETVGNQVWGFGPGHFNLRNAKRLQRLEEDSLQQLSIGNKPPLITNASNKDTLVDTSPWGLTRSNDPGGVHPGIAPLYQVSPNTADIELKIQNVERALSEGFFNNIFMMIANSAQDIKTAYQTARMMEEKYSVLGPVIERLQGMLGRLIELTFAELMANGKIPQPPEEIAGQELNIEYISILAQAQKIAGLSSIEQTVSVASNMVGIWPEVRHKIDAMQIIDEIAGINGTPPSVIRSDEDVEALMEQDQQQAAAQQALDQGQQIAQSANQLQGVDVNGMPALDVAAQAMQGVVGGGNE